MAKFGHVQKSFALGVGRKVVMECILVEEGIFVAVGPSGDLTSATHNPCQRLTAIRLHLIRRRGHIPTFEDPTRGHPSIKASCSNSNTLMLSSVLIPLLDALSPNCHRATHSSCGIHRSTNSPCPAEMCFRTKHASWASISFIG